MEHVNRIRGKNVEFLMLNLGVQVDKYWALKC